ncbi:MAG: carboxymuconolactone decarboxylase family protein [Planctomycetota bacterium]
MLAKDPRPTLDQVDKKYTVLLDYVTKITKAPATCTREDVDALRAAGASDEEIHATVQVCSYFNYINRVADALGVDLEPEMSQEAC